MTSKYDTIQSCHIQNVVRVVSLATPAQLAAGKAWYPVYGSTVGTMAVDAGLTAQQGCYLFAALSQSMPIKRNMDEYRALLSSFDAWAVGHTNPVRYACAGILAGYLEYLKGPKVTSFARNLCGDHSVVTVDRHAVSAVYNTPLSVVGPLAAYQYAEKVIQSAAILTDLSPAECQAVAWIVWRSMRGTVDAPLYPGSLAETASAYTTGRQLAETEAAYTVADEVTPTEAATIVHFGKIARGSWQRDVLYSMLRGGCYNPVTALAGRAASYGRWYETSLQSLLVRAVDAGYTITVVSGPHGGMHAATYHAIGSN